MLRLSLIAAVTLSGCCTLMPGSEVCDSRAYATGWTHKNPDLKAPCADELLAVADLLVPDPKLRPLHGVIVWHPEPFLCGLQKVWGCAPSIERDYVTVLTATGSHASDTALAEEVGHWVWHHYRPQVWPIEEWRVIDGKRVYWRDPEFKAWYESVQVETRRTCGTFNQQVFK